MEYITLRGTHRLDDHYDPWSGLPQDVFGIRRPWLEVCVCVFFLVAIRPLDDHLVAGYEHILHA